MSKVYTNASFNNLPNDGSQGSQTALYLSDVVRSVSVLGEDSCPGVISITDNKSLFDAVHSIKLTLDRH